MCRLLLVVSLVLISYLSCSAQIVSVRGPLSVIRGQHASISRSVYNISNMTNHTVTTCMVVAHDVGHQCGEVKPKRLRCDQYKFAYIHHGCLNQYEMLSFRIISQHDNSNTSHVADFSISVHVIAAETVLEISTKPVLELNNSSTRTAAHELTIHCPMNFINRCYYSFLSFNHTSLAQTTTSTLEGPALDRLVPCGQSPKHPFLYKILNSNKTDNAFTIQTSCLDNDAVVYNVLPFDSTQLWQPQYVIPKSYLRIKELAITPISHELFDFDGLLEDYSFLKMTFPVKSIGGFYPVYSSKKGYMDATVFTYSNLLRGEVVFIPNESSSASFVVITFQYHYYISDISGQPIANGIIEVLSSPRLGLKPSLRMNIGFSLYSGDKVEIDHNHLDFYPPFECLNYYMNITTYPRWGTLYSNGEQLIEGDNLLVANRNLSLTYNHDQERKLASYDTILTTINCFQHDPFDVTIPVRIIEPKVNSSSKYYYSHDIYGYPGYATHIASTIREYSHGRNDSLSVSIGNNSNYFLFRTNCKIDYLHNYPYVSISDKVWNECFQIISLNSSHLTEVQWARLWYFFPLSSQSISGNNQLIINDFGITIVIKYYVLNLLTSPDIDFMPVSTAGMANFTHAYSSIPYLRHNLPLSMHTLDATHITSHYLYVQSLGYLQTEIVYYVTSPPKEGHVCILHHTSCDSSVYKFTQEDILADLVYYKPLHKIFGISKNDSFQFEVYYLDDIKLKGRNTFVIEFNNDKENETESKQFWVPNGQSRPLLKRHLRNLRSFTNSLSKVEFILKQQPEYGFLQLPLKPTPYTFTWQDLKERTVIYHHHKDKNIVCNDVINLSVRSGQKLITIDLTVAIRYRQDNNLNVSSKQHMLDEGESFILSVHDLTISTGFCPEFVRVIVKQPPKYGSLIVNIPSRCTKRQLSTNATFLPTDISNGLISYSLYPGLTLIEDTHDQFLFSIEDPSGEYNHKQNMKRDVNSTPFRLMIVIVPVEGSGDFLNFTFSTSQTKQVIELDNNHYGAILGPNDLYLVDSSFHPSEVYFIVDQPTQYGYLNRNNYPIEEFTLADIYSNNVTYISTLPHVDTSIMSDEFLYSVYVDLYDTKRKIVADGSFNFNWCYYDVYFQSEETDAFITVQETTPSTTFNIRQIGSKSKFLTTSVHVTILPDDNNTIGINCSNTEDTTLQANEADYCTLNDTIYFSGKKTKQTLSVKLIDNNIPEDQERLIIKLSQPQGCLVPKWLDKSIYIIDREDYSLDVQFSPIYEKIPDEQCGLSFEVSEDIGTFNLVITRKGNLDLHVGVICYTVQGVDQEGVSSSDDYIHRPNTNDSYVYFLPGQTEANCSITIIDDQLNEPSEYFEVKLATRKEDFVYRKFLKSSLCVFIDHDTNDEPSVFFSSAMIKVQESIRHPIIISLTILRTGFDLRDQTSLTCLIVSTGNATLGIDYVIDGLEDITIPPKATEINISLVILNDTLVEGNEGFRIQMTKPYYGKMATPNTMEVIIVDSEKDIFVTFSSDLYLYQETQQFVQVPFHRYGNLNYETIVHCNILLLTVDNEDVLTLPETIIIPPGSTNGECNFYIYDDHVREKEEIMNVTIVTSDPSVRIMNETAVIKIVDFEDTPYATFNKSYYIIKEPLSNSMLDHTTISLTVNINGDTIVNSTVCYHTINGTALSSRDYVHSSRQLTVLPTDDKVNIAIKILNNHFVNKDTWFFVALYMCNHADDVFIGPHNVTRVTIRNRIVGGSFFPSLPMIYNFFQDGSNISMTNDLSYIAPIICITPCDINHPSYSFDECNRQDIQPDLTQYKWEISYDKNNCFVPIQLNTLLTKTDAKILQPVYFMEGVWLRCSATAVDSTGIEGFTRTSLPVQLTENSSQCVNESQQQNVIVGLTSYNEYSGRNEDLLHLTVTVPDIPNYFPLITTTPPTDHIQSLLTNSPTQYNYPCSTISHNHEFISEKPILKHDYHNQLPDLFFTHYNNCSWSFSLWLPLDTLRTQCSAQISDNQLSVNITLYIQYAQIVNNTINSFQLSNESISYNATNERDTTQSYPFNYYPINSIQTSSSSYLQIITISRQYDSQQIVIVLQSHSNNGVFIDALCSINDKQLDLTYPIKTVNNDGINDQTWIFSVTDPEVNSFDLFILLTLCSSYDSDETCTLISYAIPLVLEQGVYSTGMKLQGHTEDMTDIGSFGSSNIIKTAIMLDPMLVLIKADNIRLLITNVVICGYYDNNNMLADDCSNGDYIHQLYNRETLQDWSVVTHEINSSYITFYEESNTLLSKESSVINWYYHVTCLLQYPDYDIIEDIIIPITSIHIQSTTIASNILDNDGGMPVYATILISLMLLVLTVIGSITGVVICYGIRKNYMLRKLELESIIQKSVAVTEQKDKHQVSYKKKHVGRHIPQDKSSFHLLMKQGTEKHTKNTKQVQPLSTETRQSVISSPSLSISSSSTDTLPTTHSCPSSSNNNIIFQTNGNTIFNGSSLANSTPIATVRPLSIQLKTIPFQPSTTITQIGKSLLTERDLSFLSKRHSGAPAKPVSNPGWYERHLSRKKAMDSYVKLYLVNNNNTAGENNNNNVDAGNSNTNDDGNHGDDDNRGDDGNRGDDNDTINENTAMTNNT